MYVPGDIASLAALARPSIGVVTAVRGTHLVARRLDRRHRTRQARAGRGAAGGRHGRAERRRPARRPHGGGAAARVHVITYGLGDAADVRAVEIAIHGRAGMRFRLRTRGEEVEVDSPALGRHGVHNALAAAAVGLAAGMDRESPSRAACAGRTARRTAARCSTLAPWRVLDDSYNAAPDSMTAALDLLASLPGRHVAVLGEMLELGEASAEAHRGVGAHAARTADVLIAIGPTAADYEAGARSARHAGRGRARRRRPRGSGGAPAERAATRRRRPAQGLARCGARSPPRAAAGSRGAA